MRAAGGISENEKFSSALVPRAAVMSPGITMKRHQCLQNNRDWLARFRRSEIHLLCDLSSHGGDGSGCRQSPRLIGAPARRNTQVFEKRSTAVAVSGYVAARVAPAFEGSRR